MSEPDWSDNGAVFRTADMDFDPSRSPDELRRTSAHYAKAQEEYTLLRELRKATLVRIKIDILEKTPSLSKSEAEDLAYASKAYREYIASLAEANKNKILWEGRYAAAKADHENARTNESTRRAALYRAG